MALKTFKPYTKSVRGTILVDRKNLWKGKPFKPLTSVKNSSSGRNNLGRITARNVGGGIAHGPKGRNSYKTRKLNKNEKRQSISSILSKKLKLKEVIVFDDFSKEIKKTKEMDKILKKFDAKNSILILDKNSKDKIFRATKNIPNVKCTDIGHFSAYDILKFKKIIFTETSVKELEKRYN